MKKVFISQPMRDKTDEEILEERTQIEKYCNEVFSDSIEVMDTLFSFENKKPLYYLAKSIEKLSDADVAVFAKGWEFARGCNIEHSCCEQYGIDILYMD